MSDITLKMDSKAAFYFSVALMLAMLFAAPAYALALAAPPLTASDISALADKGVSQEIIQQLAENGTADIIIMLKGGETGVSILAETATPSAMKGARSSALARWRDAAASAQDRFLAKLSVSEAGAGISSSFADLKLKRRYETLSAVSGNATYAGLLKILADPDVEGVYPDLKVYATLTQSVPLINADDVWHTQVSGKNITGAGQTVCIIDTGVDYTHLALGGCTQSQFLAGTCAKVVGGYDYANNDANPMDDHGHGTHCAGIVASADSTYRGVAPGANIAAVKVLNSAGSGSFGNVIAGIEWCTNNSALFNISVISMSLGDGSSSLSYCNSYIPSMTTAINHAVAQGIIVVVASGNNGYSNGISFPACISSATSVGSTTKDDAISSFTNLAPILDVLAPGSSITSTYPGGRFAIMSGTSMATPHVAGAAALLKQNAQLHGGLITPAQIEASLKGTGVPISGSPRTNSIYPRISVYAIVTEEDCGNGIVDEGEQCDGGACCNTGCTFKTASTTCRASISTCDNAEACTGFSAICPADLYKNSSTVCRASAGACDAEETCTGLSATCPTDSKLSAGTICRVAADLCDAPETCTGSSTSCPADSRLSIGFVCRPAAGACDMAETCTSVSRRGGSACPVDSFRPASYTCRAAAGACDAQETCTGSSAACPADILKTGSTVCRAAAGDCDLAENCSGSSVNCSADLYKNSSTVCRPAAGDCDLAEACTGFFAACPDNIFQALGHSCSDSLGCTPVDACNGLGTCIGTAMACDDGNSSTVDSCNEANDSCVYSDTPIADLSVTADDITLSRAVSRKSKSVYITATVRNLGNLAANYFRVGIYANNALKYTKTVSALPPGSSMLVAYTWSTSSPNNATIKVAADYTRVVPELSESNNNASKVVL